MTGSEIKTLFEELVDDSLSSDTIFYQLMNTTMHKIETEMDLQILKKIDGSNTALSGSTYLTPITLPTDFWEMITLYIRTLEYVEIPFEQRELYKDTGRYYYIDYSTNKLYLT